MLKKGQPYSSKTPEKFKTPQQVAIDAYLEVQEMQTKMEKEAKEKLKKLEFEKWQNNLSEKELLELCPETEVSSIPSKVRKTMRRRKALELSKDYFEAEIWPSRKEEMDQEIINIMQDQKNLSKTS